MMNWGFLGFGGIAPVFLKSLLEVPGQRFYALASRTNHQQLKKAYSGVKVYGSYQQLVEDPAVDIVYISTTHNFHREHTLLALKAGKHVVCEKPLGLTNAEVADMVEESRKQDKFLMEAMWTRFLPAYVRMKHIIHSGEIGEVRLIKSDFSGLATDLSPDRRWLNPALAGGANYDLNVYNLSLVSDLMPDPPGVIQVAADLAETGVDISCSVNLKYPDGALAHLMSSMIITTQQDAFIYGTKGWIQMEHFWRVKRLHLKTPNREMTLDVPYKSTGFYHEIAGVVRSIDQGMLESPVMTHEHSLRVAQLLEEVAHQIRR